MNIGLIIVAIVAVALIVGPMLMLRPNPAQKNKERMRLIARAEGVHYSLRKIPQQADEQEKPDAVPVYFLPPTKTQDSPGWMLLRTRYEHEINFLGWWAWHGNERASDAELAVLREQLPALPESVRAVSAAGDGVSVYWDEKGGDAVLSQVLQLLRSLKQSIVKQG